MHLAPEQFDLDLERIFCVFMFFKSRWAAKWSENLFCMEADTGVFPISSWSAFKQYFQAQFYPVNVEVDVTNILERSFYY